MSETDLVLWKRGERNRDAEAFRELASKYSAMVFATALRVLRNAAEAEEVAQECFERLASIGRGPKGHLGGWLHRVATNRAIDRVRSDGRRKAREAHYARERGDATEIVWNDIHDYVDEAIASLPETYRAPLVAHFLEGQSHAAVASATGVSRQTVTYRIGKGVEAIREALRKQGISVAGTTLTAIMATGLAEAIPVPPSLSEAIGRVALAGAKPGLAVGGVGAGWLSWGVATIAVIAVLGLTAGFSILRDKKNESESLGQAPIDIAVAGRFAETAAPESDTLVENPQVDKPVKALSSSALVEGGVIRGRVYDSDTNEGIPGVVVSAGITKSLPSDSAGRYHIAGLEVEQYTLGREPVSGYADQLHGENTVVFIDAMNTVATIDFPLFKGVPVSGRVLNIDGDPVEEAIVYVTPPSVEWVRHGYTGADGSYKIWGFETGDQIVARAREGSCATDDRMASFHSVVHTVGAEGIQDVDLVLQPLGSLSGRVVRNGEQVVKAIVDVKPIAFLIEPPTDKDVRLGEELGVSDEHGQFKIPDLFAGTYTLSVREEEKEQVVTLALGEDAENVLLVSDAAPREETPKGPFSISGLVTDLAGTGLDRVRVYSNSEADVFVRGDAETDEEGRFTIAGLFEGDYELSVYASGFAKEERRGIRSGDRNVVLRLHRAGTIEGQVFRADTGAPLDTFSVGKLSVALTTNQGIAERLELDLVRASKAKEVHNPEGRFSLKGLEPEAYFVVAVAPGFAPKVERVDVGFGEQGAASVELRLEPEAHIAGRVVDQRGAPLPDVAIFDRKLYGMQRSAKDLLKVAVARSNAEGTFVINGLPAGCIPIAAYAPGYLIAETEVSLQSGKTTSLTLTLEAGGVVEGVVTRNGASAGAGHKVYLLNEFTHTDSDGRYRFEGMQTHESTEIRAFLKFEDEAESDSSRSLRKNAAIASGRVTQVDFEFRAATAYLHGRIGIGGKDLESGMVTLAPTGPTGLEGSHTIYVKETNGSYMTEEVPAGPATVWILCRVAGEKRKISQEILLKDGPNELNVDFTGRAMLSGKVSNLKNGEGGMVFVHRRNRMTPVAIDKIRNKGRNPGSDSLAYSPLAVDGTFHLEGLDAGSYTATVFVQSQQDNSSKGVGASLRWTLKDIVLTEGKETRVNLVLEKGVHDPT